jgi:hypothetical protein
VAFGHGAKHLALTRAEIFERVRSNVTEEAGDDFGVQGRAPASDTSHCVDELVEVGDAVFEEIADAGGVVGD